MDRSGILTSLTLSKTKLIMQEKPLTEQESLMIIQQMINRAKSDFVDTGIGPMLWGAVITFCSLVQFCIIHFKWTMPFDIWLLALFAIIPQIFISIRERRERKAKGWDDDVMGYVWLCFGIGVFVINFINNVAADAFNPIVSDYRDITGKSDIPNFWSYGSAYLLFVFGYPTIVTGAARKFRLLTIGGIVCWVSAIISAFTITKFDFLLMAISAALAWLVPGIILRKKYLQGKQQHV
jgi:hypothetical protein